MGGEWRPAASGIPLILADSSQIERPAAHCRRGDGSRLPVLVLADRPNEL